MLRLLLLSLGFGGAAGCSNILVSSGASATSEVMVSYNADSADLLGAVSHWPAKPPGNGEMRKVWSWDDAVLLGQIPESRNGTFNVMGNANSEGLIIGETTHGGREELSHAGMNQTNGTTIDYGSLIWITLQRAATAREAITIMDNLVTKYGYASEMEGFSIADPEEVWYMELVGKGRWGTGATWVALRVPDGYVAAHANQARITHFLPCANADECRTSGDAVTFAIERGYWKGAADDPAFSFSDAYDPVTVTGARFCEARVWAIFSQIASVSEFDPTKYTDYVRGFANGPRMPLWVKAKAPISRTDLHSLMSDHYSGTVLDPALDVGAGAEHSPYRWNGLEWTYKGESYANERVVGTQYTSWHFVGVARSKYPHRPMRAVLWWGADDHSWSPKIPLYGGAEAVHASYDDSDCTGRRACRIAHNLTAEIRTLSWDSAWWVANLVADTVYSRYDRAAPVVRAEQSALNEELEADLAVADEKAARLFASGDYDGAREVMTKLAVESGAKATARWKALWERLMVLFIDGKITQEDDNNPVCGCKKISAAFTDAWKAKVVDDAADHYRLPNELKIARDVKCIDKQTIRGV